ncbi:MAG: transglutaminase domain protein [Phycisphaerales bacterium]|nr:transglutaminase domain protein [Phycisphaerales bacterium]
MRYRVQHITEYRYAEPVPLCHNVVHLRPRETDRQACEATEIDVTPAPAARRDRVDFFGNHAMFLGLQEPHRQLRIECTSEVEVKPFAPPADFDWPAWEDVADRLGTCCRGGPPPDPDLLDARQFSFDSPQVPRAAALADYARPSFPPGRPVLDALLDLNRRIYTEFKFDSSATDVGTPVLEVLEHRRGVCQDVAHLAIGCLRSLGLAARYVSGYLRTRPPPGRPRLVGCDASHAWLSAFVPGFGWLDLDPTNGVVPSDGHITVGWARDYDDIAPVKGVIVGGRGHRLSVSVDVEPLDEEPALASAN